MPLLEDLFTWIQLAVLLPLALLGIHRGWMVAVYLRQRRQQPAPTPPAATAAALPAVTVQLPLYNERYVARRLIEAVAGLDYPRDRFEIQVLDDSTDDTCDIVARTLAALPADLRVVHQRRQDRTHFKAGALSAGLDHARGELIAVFDADFVPPPDFLRAVVPLFAAADVGMVQARWDHLNPDHSILTQMQALLLNGHFAIEHVARSRSGCFFNFNGTAGVFRRQCIDEAGGWQGDTLTEDMDLSYRAQLAGWRFAYRPDIACPAELPVNMNAFLNQQHRWAMGSIQTARKLLGSIWRAPVAARVKVEAGFHLLGNLAFPLLLLLILVALPLQLARLANESFSPTWLALCEGVPLLLSTACVLVYYGTAEHQLQRLHRTGWLRIPLVLAVGAGLSINNSLAVWSGLFGGVGHFQRTPKYDVGGEDLQLSDAAYRPSRGLRPLLELALGAWAGGTCAVSLSLQLPLTAAFHGLFAAGLLWVGAGSLLAELPRPAPRPASILPGS